MNDHVFMEAMEAITFGHIGARCSPPAHEAFGRVQKILLHAGPVLTAGTTISGATSLKSDPACPAPDGNGGAYE